MSYGFLAAVSSPLDFSIDSDRSVPAPTLIIPVSSSVPPYQNDYWRPGIQKNPIIVNAENMRNIVHSAITDYLNKNNFFISFIHGKEGKIRAYKILHLLSSRDLQDIPYLTWVLCWAIIHTKGTTLVESFMGKIKENYQEEFQNFYQKYENYQIEHRTTKACKEIIKFYLTKQTNLITKKKNPIIVRLVNYLDFPEEKFSVEFLCTSSFSTE